MDHREIEALTSALAPVLRGFVATALAPILEQLSAVAPNSALEALQDEVLELRGKVAELTAKPALPGTVGPQGDPGADGKSIEGPEGKPGRDGRDGLSGVQGEKGRDGIDGKDGANGLHGKDGLGIKDFEVLHDGKRTFTLRWASDDRLEERKFVVPAILDCGVYQAETAYEKGDAVSFAGSIFIAQKDTNSKPETGTDWRMGVKRGRDGKDGVLVPPKPRETLSLR